MEYSLGIHYTLHANRFYRISIFFNSLNDCFKKCIKGVGNGGFQEHVSQEKL